MNLIFNIKGVLRNKHVVKFDLFGITIYMTVF